MTMKSGNQSKARRGLLVAGLGAAAAGVVGVWRVGTSGSYPQGAPLSVDLTTLAADQLRTVNWQNRPVWILRRSPAELDALAAHEALLRDAQSQHSVQPPDCSNQYRSLKPEIFVAMGVCTHQGCTPALQSGKGFLCPCHASRYDLAGRVFKEGPAPANLVIPAYHFAAESHLLLGILSGQSG
jgi:ubiquinol-cytochrome c reductase iron-sulfur subunit